MARPEALADLTHPPVPADADEHTRLATEAWGAIARLFLSQQDRREAVAADLGLHIGDLISLFHLDPQAGTSQRTLAEHWTCDPSWVTNRVDRLEELGLAERRVSPTDRRVKEVWLTAHGAAVRTAGMAGFHQPPDAIVGLDLDDLRELSRLVHLVAPADGSPAATS